MPAEPKNFTRTELAAGTMVLAALAVFVLFVAVLRGYRPPEETSTFYVYAEDTLGLNRGADVRFGGHLAGRVVDIEFDRDAISRVKITAQVRREVPVNSESVAYVTQTTLTAQKHLALSTGEDDGALLDDGATIPFREGDVFAKANDMAESVQEVLADVRALLGVEQALEESETEELEYTLATIIEDVDGAVEEGTGLVEDARDAVGDYRDDLDTILDQAVSAAEEAEGLVTDLRQVVADSGEDISAALEHVGPILEDIRGVTDELDTIAATLQTTLDNAAGATGTADAMLDHNRPVIEDILLDVRETVRQLKTFSRTIADEPESVIRGASPAGRKTR